MARAVFLDRDGVVLRPVVREGRPYPASGPGPLDLLAGVEEACRALHDAGFLLVIVTNQPDVARGTLAKERVEAMHDELRARLPLDDILTCYHDDVDACRCRKPKAGLILDAAERWDIDVKSSYMVGDRWRDIEAGKAAGCTTVFVDRQYEESLRSPPDFTVSSLVEAVPLLLRGVATNQKGTSS